MYIYIYIRIYIYQDWIGAIVQIIGIIGKYPIPISDHCKIISDHSKKKTSKKSDSSPRENQENKVQVFVDLFMILYIS